MTVAARLEHANLVVRDIDATLRFIRTALPDWRVRHDAAGADGRRWVHVGSDDSYLALSGARVEPAERRAPYTGRPGVDHLAFVVGDAYGLRARLRAAGYRDTTIANDHPARKRVYFADPDGNDWEFVEYLSADPAERNDYAR